MNKLRLLFLRCAIQLLHFTSMRGQRWLGFVRGQKLTSSRWQISCLDPSKAPTCYKGKEWHLCNLVIQGLSISSCNCTGKTLCLGFVRSVCLKGGLLWRLETHPVQSATPEVPTKRLFLGRKKKVQNHATERDGSWVFRPLAWPWDLFLCYLMCQYSPHGVQPAGSPKFLFSLATAADEVQKLLGSYCFCRPLVWRKVSEMLPRGPEGSGSL